MASVSPAADSPRAALPAGASDAAVEAIRLWGVRVHNLRDLNLEIPRDRLVVITGPSGSGKSSLAFDTLFAEGQRQYIDSLSVYARQFLTQLERPDVDLVEGLEPTICVDQRPAAHNPRSTVATVTEVYDYLRLLWARAGEAVCHQCGDPVRAQSPEQILDALVAYPAGTKMILMAPLVVGRKGQHEEVLAAARKAGFVRVRVDGQIHELDQVPPLARQKNHTIDAVVDRIMIRDNLRPRLGESVRLALRHGQGTLAIVALEPPRGDGGPPPEWHERLFSTQQACPRCQLSFPELEPRSFSFNSPYGACPACDGLGSRQAFDPELVVPDRGKSLAGGAVAPLREVLGDDEPAWRERIAPFAAAQGFRWNTPLDKLPARVWKQLLDGDKQGFPGLLDMLEEAYAAARAPAIRDGLDAFRSAEPCPECRGARLRPESRAVRFEGRAIHELTSLAVAEAARLFGSLALADEVAPIAGPLVAEIRSRLEFLVWVGLGYLTLDRAADTLSGGELQRVRLATAIGSGLVGVCYILDEPSIGLHPRDNQRLIDSLRNLQQQGNTVLVVEHDEAIMRQADWLIDMGPGAGRDGGQVVAAGTPAEVAAGEGLTGQYLSGRMSIPLPAERRPVDPKRALVVEGARGNNLKGLTVAFPLGTLTCVTGVSGSGKSTLVLDTLARAVGRELLGTGRKPAPLDKLRGAARIDKLVEIDQSPIGRTPRSNPATYTGLWDEIRKVFAATREAKLRGFSASRFSFNVAGGRCEECQGQGVKKIEMNFLPDLYVECPTCRGQRFNPQTLEVRYRDRSIAEVLDQSIDAAAEFFENFAAIRRTLDALREVGLGYLKLGQPCTTLSGGEAQRIKLATELSRVATGKTLYILDEPTTGLHFDDVRKLLAVLNRLVDLGNTVVVIEHNLDVIRGADWLIDLGPEGGEAGGQLLAAGRPEDLAALLDNATGQFLRQHAPATSGR